MQQRSQSKGITATPKNASPDNYWTPSISAIVCSLIFIAVDYQNIYAILLNHCKIVLHRKFYDITISILGLYRRFNLF